MRIVEMCKVKKFTIVRTFLTEFLTGMNLSGKCAVKVE